jgi:hypothetical protein
MGNALLIVLLIALLIGVALLILSLGTFLILALPARHSRQARTEGVLRELLEENHINTSTPSGVNQIRFLRETLTANGVDSSDSVVDSRRPPPRYEQFYRHAAEFLKDSLSEAG